MICAAEGPVPGGLAVASTAAGPQFGGDHPQQLVAGRVPEPIVDRLEPVEVDEEQRTRLTIPEHVAHLGEAAPSG